jgi:hypothetical protein
MCRRRGHLDGAALLRASEVHGKNKPSDGYRQGAQGDPADLQAERQIDTGEDARLCTGAMD